MSEQPTDERGIDEILASIDEMLADKSIYSYKPTKKVEISSLLTKPSAKNAEKQQAKKKEQKAPVKKVVLSQNNLADAPATPASKKNAAKTEANPFDFSAEELSELETQHDLSPEAKEEAVTSETDQVPADKKADQTDNSADSQKDSADIGQEAEKKAEQEAADEPEDIGDSADLEEADDFDEEYDFDETDDEETSTESDEEVTPKHRIVLTEAFLEPSAQEALPLWIEQDESDKQDNTATAAKSAAKGANAQTRLPGKMREKQASVQKQKTDFDGHEPIVRNELVEAIVHDALQSKPEELSSAVKHEMTAIVSKYELQQLANIITEEVSSELQKQLQEVLPKLIQKSLRQHFELSDNE